VFGRALQSTRLAHDACESPRVHILHNKKQALSIRSGRFNTRGSEPWSDAVEIGFASVVESTGVGSITIQNVKTEKKVRTSSRL
jgi:hypothetical protein